jgi:hypothetical protein
MPGGCLFRERRSTLRRHPFALLLVAAIAIVASGCGEANPGQFPEGSHPGASREGVTPIKPFTESQKAKMSEKAKAAAKAADKSDPRGR